jgi:hypothetical protein
MWLLPISFPCLLLFQTTLPVPVCLLRVRRKLLLEEESERMTKDAIEEM